MPALEQNEILYIGRHHYESRVVRDGCNIDDLLKQIESALSDKSRIYYGSKNDRHSVNNATQ